MKNNWDLSELDEYIEKALENTKKAEEVTALVAEDMRSQVKIRFRTTQDVDGKKWDPLAEVTKKYRINKSNVPLSNEGELKNSISTYSDKKKAVTGTNDKRAGTHNFGLKRKTSKGILDIPARPFMGISKRQEEKYLKLTIQMLFGRE